MVDKKTSSNTLTDRLGRNIAQRRKDLGWTQAVLAERMKMEPESISRFERGATTPSLATLEELARCLNSTVAGLLAEYPTNAYSEAQQISGWLSPLNQKEKAEVLDIVQRVCGLVKASR